MAGGAGNDVLEGGAGADLIYGEAGDDTAFGHSQSGSGDDGAADQLFGGDGNDTLHGQLGNDILQGDAGDDHLLGGAGTDALRGMTGSDLLEGGDGDDQLFGGEHADRLDGGAGVDTLHGDEGDDTLYGHSQSGAGDDNSADNLFGDAGNDLLFGQGGNDLLHGGAGADTLYGGAGNDLLEGDAGADALHGDAGDDSLFGHSQTGTGDDAAADTLFGGDSNDTLHGNAGADQLHGGAGADTLYGDAGDDTLEGDSGADLLIGGAGDDQLYGHSATAAGDDNAADTLYGDYGTGHPQGSAGDPALAGDDRLFGQGGDDLLYGERGNDRLWGGSGNDTARGGEGDDYLEGGAGDDQLEGEAGSDRLYGGVGADTVRGGDGDDQLYGGAGGDTLYGDAGEDQLYGEAGEDFLYGGIGNDVLIAGLGVVNRLDGEEGDDRLVGSDEGTDDPNLNDTVYFGDILSGGPGNDEIFGLGGADIVDGGTGDDWIDGGAHGDLLRGNAGNDTIYGGHGSDTLEGDDGNDQLYGELGTDTLRGGAGDDYLHGGADADQIYGGTGHDELDGGGGAGDQLFGEEGADVLLGSDDGADSMFGGPGRDRLMGRGGNDALHGGDDDDVLLGGAGDDLLEGDAGSDTLAGEAGHDTLYGHHVVATGDDNQVDYLYGDFATGGSEPGSGRDRLFGGGGNDFLFGEGDDDLIDAGAGTAEIIDYGSGEGAIPSQFVPPTPTPNPSVLPDVAASRTAASLPTGASERTRWQQFAGSGSGNGLSDAYAGAIDPTIAVSPSGHVYAAWSDARNGNFEIYVARWNGTAWQELAGSAAQGGLSRSVASSLRPSLNFNAAGEPLVAWRESGDIYVAAFDPAAAAGAGGWVALGSSLSAGGISSTAAADQPIIVNTQTGPVVAWLNENGGTAEIRVRRWTGSAWVSVGASVATSAAGLGQLALATDGTKLAIAWAQPVAGVSRVYALEFAGTSWQAIAGSASGPGISPAALAADQPTLAYEDGTLYVAWRQSMRSESTESEIFAASSTGSAWTSAGPGATTSGVSPSGGTASLPRLAAGAGELHLVWAEDLQSAGAAARTTIYATTWNGSAFAEKFVQSGDLAGGIKGAGDGLQSIALATNLLGQPIVAWNSSESGLPQVYVRGDLASAGRVFYTSPGISLNSLLSLNTLQPGDTIVLSPGTNLAGATLTAAHSGISIVGSGPEFSTLVGLLTIDGANNVTIAGVHLAGGLVAVGTDGLHVLDSRISGPGLTLDTTTGSLVLRNAISGAITGITLRGNAGLVLETNEIHGQTIGLHVATAESGARIASNRISATGTALRISAAVDGLIADNDLQNAALGVEYSAAATLSGNRVHHNTVGVRVAVSQVATGLGFVGTASANDIYANTTGVELFGRMQGQVVRDNAVGVNGSGVLGGSSLQTANHILRNTTGVDFSGTIQFNRIAENTTGIRAKSNSLIVHNLISRNTVVGILASGVVDVQIAQNTIYAPQGDAVSLQSASREIEVRNNILWVEAGTALYVGDNSRTGFYSDYNLFHATGTGKLVHWMVDFTDLLDWQLDVARFDLHSTGTTVVNPLGALPSFVSLARGEFSAWDPIAGWRHTSPSLDGGDPRIDLGVPPSRTNLLTNASFDTGTAGWITSAGATSGTPNGSAFDGTTYFVPGSIATGLAEQTVDLVAAGLSLAQLDSQNLVAVFGGRVRSKSEAPIDTASVTIEFRTAGGAILAQHTRSAANVGDRWDLVGDRLALPVGTRQITYRFTALRSTGTTNDAYLDGAFLYLLSEAVAPDYGAVGNTDDDSLAASPRVALRYPDLYVDWQRDVAKTIRWETFGNSTNSPVRIELLQDGPQGPALLATITNSTLDDGEFIWIPANSGINFDTTGLRLQVSLVNHPLSIGRAAESFAVPDAGMNYYVDDRSNAGDEYTPGAVGSNRNTGKTPLSPKPHPVNLLRAYDLPAGAVVSIDTGSYPLFDALRISGTQNLGLGIEEAFTLRGPTDPSRQVALSWIYPDGHPQALIELADADFMTLANLRLIGSQRGLWVTGGSDNFSASYITARNQSLDGIDITPLNSAANFVGLVAQNTGRHGIVITGPFASLTDGEASGNADRGILLTSPGSARIEAMHVFGTAVGIDVNNVNSPTRTIIGSEQLASGRGNLVRSNGSGIRASGNILVAGNTVHDHRQSIFATGIQASNGTDVVRNLVYDNYGGISSSGSAIVRENTVYRSTKTGISVSSAATVSANVVYQNELGILASAASGLFNNNVIFGNLLGGIKFTGGSGADLVNNTIYQTWAPPVGSVARTTQAVRVEGSASNLTLRNNILWAVGAAPVGGLSQIAYGISISNDSQAGFVSDYNLLYASGPAGYIGQWLATSPSTLSAWRNATGRDTNSLTGDPLFVDVDGDFHLQSPHGSLHGGSLAPVQDAQTLLPVFAPGELTSDAALSPGIDRGTPGDSFAAEPAPNGGYVNLGAYGNTSQASLSEEPLLLVESPNGGELIAQGSTVTVRWRASGFAGNVTIEVSSSGPAGPFELLSAGEANDGAYTWLVSAATFSPSADYFLRIRSDDTPAVVDLSDAAFQISVPNTAYFVNIAGDANLADNEYTTAAGSDTNSGLSSDSPMASLQALLNAYDLGPGDIVYIDTGVYAVTTNLLIGAADSGVRIQGPVGAGNRAALNRGNTAAGSYVIQLAGAANVTIDSLEIYGGNVGISVGTDSHDFTLSRSIVRNNSTHGVHLTSAAHRATLVDNEMYSNATAVQVEGDDVTIRQNLLRNNTSGGIGRGIEITSAAANPQILENTLRSNWYGLLATQPSSSGLVVQGNTVQSNSSAGLLVNGGGLILENTVFGSTTGVGIQTSGSFVEIRNNTVYSNRIGIRTGGGAVATGNRVYGHSDYGFYMENGVARENVIYANGIGIYVNSGSVNVIASNLIYANNTYGIEQVDSASTILGNTIYQPTGDAIRHRYFFTAPGSMSVFNNILSVGTGSALNVAAQHQTGFNSDYNLFQVTAGGRVATWGSTAFSNWEAWQFQTARDRHSLTADPQFVDIDGADDVLGSPDDDFHLSLGSPALDAGHPLSLYGGEPASGGRVDLGAFGNTAATLPSSTPRIQLIEPTTYQKLELGQPITVHWLTAGLTNPGPALLMNNGGGSVNDASGRWSGDLFRTGITQSGTISLPVDVSAVLDPPPTSVIQSYAYEANSGVGNRLRYDLPLADGTYEIRLFFAEPTLTSVGGRRFDVRLQGQTVLANYDVFADAGAVRKAVAKTFTVTASGGAGLDLEFINRTAGAIINAIEVTRVDAAAPATFTVDLEFSSNGGESWSTIATSLTSNRFGEGSFVWNVEQVTSGHSGLFRATAVAAGLGDLVDATTRPISVVPPASSFYINTNGDADFTDNEYTTAAGNDLNTGTTPDSPMASLAVLLGNYTLGPGDVVYVDSGVYNLTDNLELTAAHAGVRIQGPQQHAAVFNRGNTSAGNYVFQFRDAAGVTLDSLEIMGGNIGIRVEGASHDVNILNSSIHHNLINIHVLSTVLRTSITGNDVYSNTGPDASATSIDIEGDNVLIADNVIRNNAQAGIQLRNSAQSGVIRGK